ncbi:hypothetical protein, partial [Streptomyces cahuitamycinicus]
MDDALAIALCATPHAVPDNAMDAALDVAPHAALDVAPHAAPYVALDISLDVVEQHRRPQQPEPHRHAATPR